jgi:small subunit ribosomal protein S20
MAHTISAKKRIRQTARRTILNKSRTSRIRTYVRKVEEAVRAGDKKAAEAAYKAMMPELHKGVSKGLLHRNTVARKLSRLSTRINAL